jgi:hypothetical protein
MYRSVTKVEPTDNFELIIEFDTGEKRLFNVKPIFSYGRFIELKDIHTFKKVHISFDTVEWENGLDLDPEYLYSMSQIISEV